MSTETHRAGRGGDECTTAIRRGDAELCMEALAVTLCAVAVVVGLDQQQRQRELGQCEMVTAAAAAASAVRVRGEQQRGAVQRLQQLGSSEQERGAEESSGFQEQQRHAESTRAEREDGSMAWPRRQQTEREPVSAADDVHAEPAVISRPAQQWSSCSAASAEPATVEGSQSIGGQATSRLLSSSALGVFSISIAAGCGRDDSGAQPEEGDPVTVTAAGTATVTEDGEWQMAAQQTTRGRTAAVTMGEAERLPAVSHGSGARTVFGDWLEGDGHRGRCDSMLLHAGACRRIVSSDWARLHRLQGRSRICSLIRSWGVVSVPTDSGTMGSGDRRRAG